MTLKAFLGVFASVLIVVGLFYWMIRSDDRESSRPLQVHRLRERKQTTVADLKKIRDDAIRSNPGMVKAVKTRKRKTRFVDDVSPAERLIIDQIDVALNAEDFNEILALTAKLADSTNETARLRAVEALGWFDDAALPELTPFLMDADDGVRDAARDQWSASLDQVSDMDFKASVIEATMQIVNDPDLLEDIAFHFNELPTFTAVESLVALINGDNEAAAEVALETYSFLTGSEYSSFDEAQRWVDENIDFDEEPDDMPVYRASQHLEVFDETVDLTGIKVVNDTDTEIPPRAGEESKEAADAESARQYDDASDGSAYEVDTE